MNPQGFSEELKCSMCKGLYKNPMMLSCGHSFCKVCLDEEFQARNVRKCPSCQQMLSPGQNPTPNTLLGSFTSRLLQQKKEHCETHGEKFLFFCLDCGVMGCIVCRDSTKHANHTFMPLQEATEMYKSELNGALHLLETRLQLLKHIIRNQEEEIQKHETSAGQLERHVTSEFEKLYLYLQSRENELKAELRKESAANVQVMERNLAKVEEERQKMEESISCAEAKKHNRDMKDFLSDIKDFLYKFSRQQEEDKKIVTKVERSSLSPGLYRGPIQYMAWENMKTVVNPCVSNIILDPKTAHPALSISDDLTTILYRTTEAKAEDTAKRYDTRVCVLGSRGFRSGRHYWMVDVGKKVEWTLGLAQEGSNRKGDFALTPEEGYWTIERRTNGIYSALLDPPKVLQVEGQPRRIGVYVDYEGGQVSFYNLNNMSHLHTFTSLFIESLYPFISPCGNERDKIRVFHLRV